MHRVFKGGQPLFQHIVDDQTLRHHVADVFGDRAGQGNSRDVFGSDQLEDFPIGSVGQVGIADCGEYFVAVLFQEGVGLREGVGGENRALPRLFDHAGEHFREGSLVFHDQDAAFTRWHGGCTRGPE